MAAISINQYRLCSQKITTYVASRKIKVLSSNNPPSLSLRPPSRDRSLLPFTFSKRDLHLSPSNIAEESKADCVEWRPSFPSVLSKIYGPTNPRRSQYDLSSQCSLTDVKTQVPRIR